MLDTSVLGEMTVEACAAVTGRQDAAALLRAIDTAHLFLVALDDEWTSFRYHRLVCQILRAELRARDRARERVLQLRAAEWFEATGDIGARPIITWPRSRPTGRWPSCRTGSSLTSCLSRRWPAPLDLGMVHPLAAVRHPGTAPGPRQRPAVVG